MEKSNQLTDNFEAILPFETPVTIITSNNMPIGIVSTWSHYVQVVDKQTMLIPAAGMHSIEQASDKSLTLTFGAHQLSGSEGIGRGYYVDGQGEFQTSGNFYDQMKAKFPWMRAVLIVHVTKIEQKI